MFANMANDPKKIKPDSYRVAILDLYEGKPNQGMRCIREILNSFAEINVLDLSWDEFDVRGKCAVPDISSYDVFISSGGPGSPLESEGTEWENTFFKWVGHSYSLRDT